MSTMIATQQQMAEAEEISKPIDEATKVGMQHKADADGIGHLMAAALGTTPGENRPGKLREAPPPMPIPVATTQAAEPVQPDTGDLPGVGTMVVYRPRPGEGRAARMEFPAIVMHHNSDRSLALLVIFDSEDLSDRHKVFAISAENPHPAWVPVAGDHAQVEGARAVVEAVAGAMMDGIDQRLTLLAEKVLGPYEAPTKSVMEHLADFADRLSALERVNSAGPKEAKRRGRPPRQK